MSAPECTAPLPLWQNAGPQGACPSASLPPASLLAGPELTGQFVASPDSASPSSRKPANSEPVCPPLNALAREQPFAVHCGDAVDFLRQLPASSVDLVVTDPAYESLEKHRAIGTTTRLKQSKASSNQWFQIFPNRRFPELFQEVYRVLRKNTHFYLFCDQETMFVAKPAAEAAGFKFWKPLVWDKRRIGMGYHYRSRYEFILFFEKGKRKLRDLSLPDIIEQPRIHRGYPAEKPAAVAEVLIRQSTEPGDLVVDPFTGSGSTGIAALGQARRFQGCDICPEAVAVSLERLRAVNPLKF